MDRDEFINSVKLSVHKADHHLAKGETFEAYNLLTSAQDDLNRLIADIETDQGVIDQCEAEIESVGDRAGLLSPE